MTTTLDTTPVVGRGAALTAAVAGPLILVLSFTQPPDGPDMATASAAQIRTWALSQATALRIGALGGVLSLAVLLTATAALSRVIRDALPRSLLADLFAGAGLLLIGSLFLNSTAWALPAVLPGLIGADLATVDDATLRGWYALTGFTHLLGDFQMIFIAVMVGAFSAAALRARMVPRWVGWLGVVITLSAVLGTVGITTSSDLLYGFWFGGLFGWVLWYPIVGIALGLRSRHTSAG
ncbi:hypothetical protein OHA21_09365 [Actinoplanes sp. NBC_00393]|uniref:hypothetical protein n=1 Tax=Actinoplanes sp. NBC_00393 TaxID=2975953 RepID=UPI002E24754C